MSTAVYDRFKFWVRVRLFSLKPFILDIFLCLVLVLVFLQANARKLDLLVIAIMNKGPLISVIFIPCRCKVTVGDSIVWGKEPCHVSFKEIWNFIKHITLMSGTWNGEMNNGSLFWIFFLLSYTVFCLVMFCLIFIYSSSIQYFTDLWQRSRK